MEFIKWKCDNFNFLYNKNQMTLFFPGNVLTIFRKLFGYYSPLKYSITKLNQHLWQSTKTYYQVWRQHLFQNSICCRNLFLLFCPPPAYCTTGRRVGYDTYTVHTATNDDIMIHRHTLRSWLTCCRLSGTGLLSEFPGGNHLDQTVISIHSAGFSHTAHVDKQHGGGNITWLHLIQYLLLYTEVNFINLLCEL